jgi:excisionase family DNA binding protein
MKTQDPRNEKTSSVIGLQSLLCPVDVAGVLGVSSKTVHKLVRDGKLSCVQVTGRERRFTQEQVQDYIRSQTMSVRVDKKPRRPLSSPPRKGGEKSFGSNGVSLREEIKQWR